MSPNGGTATLELGRARASYALKRIQSVPESMHAAYGRLVRRLPIMILQNGLGQAIAFHLADAKNDQNTAAGRVVLDVSKWLICRGIYPNADSASLSGLIGALVAGDHESYQRAQQESLALLDWMKRFADAFLPREDR